MYDNEFFVVDMASCTSTGEIINNLSLALETLNHSEKKIVLKLNNTYFNQSQMLSMQSLITSYGCTLDTIETNNEKTVEVAQNMNILVQKPIENRLKEETAQNNTISDFQPFSMDTGSIEDTSIALKDVNGLHFEADLDAIQYAQDKIDVTSELRQTGIDPKSDFRQIEEQISAKYSYPKEENEKELIKTIPSVATLDKLELQTKESNMDIFENAEKKSIGIYKKAYDENEISQDEWEEVDFYETSTNEPVISDTKTTTYINQTLRSGQILESEGNVVIIGDCHPGSEIRAVGDITVWGVLSGIAHAGCKGNNSARVRALKLNAVQLRIGDCYSRRPDTTNIPYIIRSSIFTPEEARVVDNEIMLFKINQN